MSTKKTKEELLEGYANWRNGVATEATVAETNPNQVVNESGDVSWGRNTGIVVAGALATWAGYAPKTKVTDLKSLNASNRPRFVKSSPSDAMKKYFKSYEKQFKGLTGKLTPVQALSHDTSHANNIRKGLVALGPERLGSMGLVAVECRTAKDAERYTEAFRRYVAGFDIKPGVVLSNAEKSKIKGLCIKHVEVNGKHYVLVPNSRKMVDIRIHFEKSCAKMSSSGVYTYRGPNLASTSKFSKIMGQTWARKTASGLRFAGKIVGPVMMVGGVYMTIEQMNQLSKTNPAAAMQLQEEVSKARKDLSSEIEGKEHLFPTMQGGMLVHTDESEKIQKTMLWIAEAENGQKAAGLTAEQIEDFANNCLNEKGELVAPATQIAMREALFKVYNEHAKEVEQHYEQAYEETPEVVLDSEKNEGTAQETEEKEETTDGVKVAPEVKEAESEDEFDYGEALDDLGITFQSEPANTSRALRGAGSEVYEDNGPQVRSRSSGRGGMA